MRDPAEVQKKKARDAVTRAIMTGRLTPGPSHGRGRPRRLGGTPLDPSSTAAAVREAGEKICVRLDLILEAMARKSVRAVASEPVEATLITDPLKEILEEIRSERREVQERIRQLDEAGSVR